MHKSRKRGIIWQKTTQINSFLDLFLVYQRSKSYDISVKIQRKKEGPTILGHRRRRMVSLADSVAPKALYPPFFLGRGNKEVGPLLKKTENRQYRAGPEKTENRFRNPVQDTKRLGFPSWMKTWILASRHEKPGQPEQRIRVGISLWPMPYQWNFWNKYLKYNSARYMKQYRKVLKKFYVKI